MDEEKRIITIYPDIDYDGSVEKLKETLKKFDAELKAANADEYQILIAKSKLEDLCNELDLDIDDLTEEWDSYVPDDQTQSPESVAVMGKIDEQLSNFDFDKFFIDAKQNKRSVSARLQKDDVVYELYVDFEDKVYVEFWKITFKDDAANSQLIFEASFDENDFTSWKSVASKLQKWADKKFADKPESKHVRHHDLHHEDSCDDTCDSCKDEAFSVEAAMLLDEAEEASTLEDINEAQYLAQGALEHHQISKEEYDRIMQILSSKSSNAKDSVDAYEFDEKTAKKLKEELMEDANADLPKNIDFAITSRGGDVESMRVSDDTIHVLWHLKDFKSDNVIYLSNVESGVKHLAEDIAHALWKADHSDETTVKDEKLTYEELLKKVNEIDNADKLKDAEYLINSNYDADNISSAERHRLLMILAYRKDELSDKNAAKFKTDKGREYYFKLKRAATLDQIDRLIYEIDDDESLDTSDYELLMKYAEYCEKVISVISKSFDSSDRHTVNISNIDMKDVAAACDMFDDIGLRYSLSDDELTINCGPQQWKELQARFKILRGE